MVSEPRTPVAHFDKHAFEAALGLAVQRSSFYLQAQYVYVGVYACLSHLQCVFRVG